VGEDRQLDPRVIPLQRTVGAIVSAILAAVTAVAAVAAVVDSDRPMIAAAVIGGLWLIGNAVLFWHWQRWPAIAYRHTWYRVDEQGIEIRRGVFWRVVINVPRTRVQHTDVAQGPLDRRYGLGMLVVYTAGTDHAKVTLEGLDHGVALAIREQLMPERGSDAV
jgi:membrane protein YdbS with pleckstrin-like domain